MNFNRREMPMRYLMTALLALTLAACGANDPPHLGAWEHSDFTVEFVDDSTALMTFPEVNLVEEYRYEVDYSKDPHWLTLTSRGHLPEEGIITVRGDSLWWTESLRNKTRRPIRHITEPHVEGTDTVNLIITRVLERAGER